MGVLDNYLINGTVAKPIYHLMERAYKDYRADHKPCKRGNIPQCAVRMSIALRRCGFTLDTGWLNPRTIIHTGGGRCIVTIPHAVSAEQVKNYLLDYWGASENYSGSDLEFAHGNLQGRKGIIYFDNCFVRERNRNTMDSSGRPIKLGDHIDLWNGQQYFNQVLGLGADGRKGSANDRLFNSSEEIRFFPLA